MTIRFSKNFRKQLKNLSVKEQKQFYTRLQWFILDNYDSRLRNHMLAGKFKGLRSISISGDLRALYEVVGDEVYLYQMIGSHSQLYG